MSVPPEPPRPFPVATHWRDGTPIHQAPRLHEHEGKNFTAPTAKARPPLPAPGNTASADKEGRLTHE